ncbi:MAG: metallophosphoesterase [Bacteroidota bacterium]
MNVLIFFLIVVVILGGGYAYIGWRLIASSSLTGTWSLFAWITLIALFVIPPIAFSLQINRIENSFTDFLAWASYLSMGFVSMVFTLLVFRDIIHLTSAGIQKILIAAKDFFQSASLAALNADPGRREFLFQASNVVIIAGGGLLTGYGLYEARRKPAVLEVAVPIKNLPADLEGFRILQVTDIHAGLTVKRPFVEMVAEQMEGISADLIAMTGDLVDGTVRHLREHVEPFKHLSAPSGQFFITGNHEYYSGVEPWIEEVDRLGYTVLLNEHRVIKRGNASILLSGITDYSAGDFDRTRPSDPARSVEGAPRTDVRILLAHQPRSIFAAQPFKFDLQISGHTHGGQFFPWNFLAAVGQPYISGLHKHENTWVYVSKGTGYWGPPVRLAARSELTILTLTRAVPTA